MTNKEAIKYLQQLYPNGGHCWLDEQRTEAIGMAIQALQEEPVSEELEEEIKRWEESFKHCPASMGYKETARHFANWQKQQAIDKAAKWLKCAGKYHWYDPIEHNEGFGTDRLIEDYKKYMED